MRFPLLSSLLVTLTLAGAAGCELDESAATEQAELQYANHTKPDVYFDRNVDKAQYFWMRGTNGEEVSELPALKSKVEAAIKVYDPSDAVHRLLGTVYDSKPDGKKARAIRVSRVWLVPRMGNTFTKDVSSTGLGPSAGSTIKGQGEVWCGLFVRTQLRTLDDDGVEASGTGEVPEANRTATQGELTGTVTGSEWIANGSYGVTWRVSANIDLAASRPAARDACLALSESTFNTLFSRGLNAAVVETLKTPPPVPGNGY